MSKRRASDDDDYIVNPATNRRVLKSGRIGRQLCAAEDAAETPAQPHVNPILQLDTPCLHSSTRAWYVGFLLFVRVEAQCTFIPSECGDKCLRCELPPW